MIVVNKYRLTNLDCASCAAELEEHVQQLPGVRYASLNFATATLHLDADNIATVEKAIRRVEPNVEVHPEGEAAEERGFDAWSQLVGIGVAVLLFVLGLIFNQELHETPYSLGEYLVFGSAYLLTGWGVLTSAARNLLRRSWFDESFLMSIATLGAFLIHELPEAVGVMLFYRVGEFLQELSVERSRRSIRSLLAMRPQSANLIVGEEVRQVPPDQVQAGETIVVRAGEKVPLDGVVLEGLSQVDTSALTGESMPRTIQGGDEVLAGMVNQNGVLRVRVERAYADSSIAKMLELVETAADRKARTEKFITQLAKYYTPVVVALAAGIAVLPPLIFPEATFREWVYRALVLLVISCPCALVISIPLGYFGGIGGASRRGILVKGANFLDVLADVKTVVFDKTGTLTRGVFQVSKVIPSNGYDRDEILRIAVLVEAQSNHPIAQSIRQAYGRQAEIVGLEVVEEMAGLGLRAKLNGEEILIGSDALMHHKGVAHDLSHCEIYETAVHLAVGEVYSGCMILSDELKEDAQRSIEDLRAAGVENVVILSGDQWAVAERVADALRVDRVEAQLLPQGKVAALEELLDYEGNGKVAFIGDGINDAPVIARADVGIAMGAMGSDAAIETADVVLMTDSPTKVAEAIRLGRRTRRIVWQNIWAAFLVKAAFIALGAAGLVTMGWAVFADVGVAVLATFNATRVLK